MERKELAYVQRHPPRVTLTDFAEANVIRGSYGLCGAEEEEEEEEEDEEEEEEEEEEASLAFTRQPTEDN
uniref:Uncharacterized protein n=1 Tax=Vespula pensylvanica TaxID=30213 RepID=A0A834PCF5_VESPE|nr:hypothetical protein H0235_003624 [Vespula pensylvanica]